MVERKGNQGVRQDITVKERQGQVCWEEGLPGFSEIIPVLKGTGDRKDRLVKHCHI